MSQTLTTTPTSETAPEPNPIATAINNHITAIRHEWRSSQYMDAMGGYSMYDRELMQFIEGENNGDTPTIQGFFRFIDSCFTELEIDTNEVTRVSVVHMHPLNAVTGLDDGTPYLQIQFFIGNVECIAFSRPTQDLFPPLPKDLEDAWGQKLPPTLFTAVTVSNPKNNKTITMYQEVDPETGGILNSGYTWTNKNAGLGDLTLLKPQEPTREHQVACLKDVMERLE